MNFDLSYSLELLHAFREYLTIVSNTDARPAAEAQAAHERCMITRYGKQTGNSGRKCAQGCGLALQGGHK